jgi:LemA protein
MEIPILVLVVGGLITYVMVEAYNRPVAMRNRYQSAYDQIDAQLQQRYDIIPSLVETVKGYLANESETLEAVVTARNKAINANARAAIAPGSPTAMEKLGEAEGILTGALGRLLAAGEAYPSLQTNETMIQLKEELVSSARRVCFARQSFNEAVNVYNKTRKVFPNNLAAKQFNFASAAIFPTVALEVKGARRQLGNNSVISSPRVQTKEPIWISSFAKEKANSVGDEYAALACIYDLLLDKNHSRAQLAYLAQREVPAVLEQMKNLRATVTEIPNQHRLAVLEQQVTNLRGTQHVSRLLRCAYGMVEFLPPTDWPIAYLVVYHRLAPNAGTQQEVYRSIDEVWKEAIDVLSTLAHMSSGNSQHINYTFEIGLSKLPKAKAAGASLQSVVGWREFQMNLSKIACATPKVKQVVIMACLEALTSQPDVSMEAIDMMRSIAILLDAPVPPILDRISAPQRMCS